MSGWSIDLGKYATDTVEKTNQVCRKVSIEVFRRVIFRTPVGNPALWKVPYKPKGYVGGRARNNWFASVGMPSSETTNYPAPTGQAPVSRASRQTALWDPSKGQSIFLTNNLPYIEVLERGRVGNKGSLQAPQGMVGITVAEFGGIVSEEAT